MTVAAMRRSGFRGLSLAGRQVNPPSKSVSPEKGSEAGGSDAAAPPTSTASSPRTSTKSTPTTSSHTSTKTPTSTKSPTSGSKSSSPDPSGSHPPENNNSASGSPTASSPIASGSNTGSTGSATASLPTDSTPPQTPDSLTNDSGGRLSVASTPSPSATPFADITDSSVLHNKTSSALIFTFSALAVVAVVGLMFYCCYWRRRRDMRHVMLGDDDTSDGHRGILRSNSNGSSATRRPMSAASVLSDGHYLPARFAGIMPISRHHGFDTAHIENDPYSVHRVVYPDPPGTSDDGHRRSYVLYPDPVPPPRPLRVNYPKPPPRPPQVLADIVAAAGLPSASAVREPRSPPRSPNRRKVPPLPPSLSSHGHDSDIDAQSADSHFEEDLSSSHPPVTRTFLFDRRPDTGKRRSQ